MYLYSFIYIFLSSFFLTAVIRYFSIKYEIFDTPNERSSHSELTPRVGGLAITLTFFTSIYFIGLVFPKEANLSYSLLLSGMLIAGVGFWDDLKDISSKLRLLIHFLAAINVIYWLNGSPPISILGALFESNIFTISISIILLVWFLNLFNFMDGIDGIAASETIFVSSAGAYFSWLSGLEMLFYTSMALSFSTLGFLIFNWPPAKIFMGDVGSGFLGLTIGILAYANAIEGISLWVWFILFSVFLVDSTYTLVTRFAKGEKWYVAHCSHAYQHAARRFGHKKVSVSVTLINILWLFPISYLSYVYQDYGVVCFVVALLPLIYLANKFNAGLN